MDSATRRRSRAVIRCLPLLFPAVALAQAGPPGTDIYLIPLHSAGGAVTLGAPVNVTHRPGYDNQPSFTPDSHALLFTRVGSDGQADIFRYDLETRATTAVTHTSESEYSGTVTPDGSGISVIRVEADSTQRLWWFPLEGNVPPRLLVADVRPAGYHAWLDVDRVLLFVLGTPATAQLVDLKSGIATMVARDVGRSLHRIPGRAALSYTQRVEGGAGRIMEYVPGQDPVVIAPMYGQGQDYAWMPDRVLIMADGEQLVRWDTSREAWLPLGEATGVGRATRLAVSPDGRWLAVVADEATTRP